MYVYRIFEKCNKIANHFIFNNDIIYTVRTDRYIACICKKKIKSHLKSKLNFRPTAFCGAYASAGFSKINYTAP